MLPCLLPLSALRFAYWTRRLGELDLHLIEKFSELASVCTYPNVTGMMLTFSRILSLTSIIHLSFLQWPFVVLILIGVPNISLRTDYAKGIYILYTDSTALLSCFSEAISAYSAWIHKKKKKITRWLLANSLKATSSDIDFTFKLNWL